MFIYAGFMLAAVQPLNASSILIWSDEMDTDGLPNPDKWMYDVGGGGWGNNEAQFYTENRLENARVENGILIIEARQEPWPSPRNRQNEYTSARLISKGTGDWLYGRIEVRAKLPAGRGTWPAIWMLPTGDAYGRWPRSGEIDIMEHVGYDMGRVHGSLHSLANNWVTETQPTGSVAVANVDQEFHTYSVDWSPDGIRFAVDGVEFMHAPNPATGWEAWPFDQPFYLIMNLAVGGFWGGQQGIDPDIWPQRLEIDYVRVYDNGHTVALDTDGDGIPNALDPDDDGDGIPDREEHRLGTNILKADTDGDGFTDFEEIQAGTNPLLSGSYPGRDPSILMINSDLQEGEEPWILHTNRLDADGLWIGQAGSWGGAYAVYDYVTPSLDRSATLRNYTAGDAPGAEHLLYQEWSAIVLGLQPGDVIRFRGTARIGQADPALSGVAFIRVLDGAYQRLPETAELVLGTNPVSFALESVIGTAPVNVLQVGVALTGPQTAAGTLIFADLFTTRNEQPTWAGYPVTDDVAHTGGWLGMVHTARAPWLWSFAFGRWLYAAPTAISDEGGWLFVPR
jgi:beta-glucanase (GH16 family)